MGLGLGLRAPGSGFRGLEGQEFWAYSWEVISLGFLGRGGRGVAKDHGILQAGFFLRDGQSSVVGLAKICACCPIKRLSGSFRV